MLTKRQKEVLEFIKEYIEKKGYSPTLKEIDERFKMVSTSAAQQHVAALITKGYLKKSPFQKRSIEVYKNEEDVKEIPLLGRIALGEPIENFSEPETIKVPRLLLCGSGDHYALEAMGDSMNEDNIFDGDILVIKHTSTPENGDIVVAQTSGYAATLKRYYDHGTKIELRPKSSNPKYKPIFYLRGELNIQGKFCGLIRRSN